MSERTSKTSGAATWQTAYYDPDVNLIFMGTGNPAPWNSWLRPGDNLYSSSTVAVDPDTGKIVWHYQNTPHDGWDFDGVNEFISFEYKDPKTGKLVKAGAKAEAKPSAAPAATGRTRGKKAPADAVEAEPAAAEAPGAEPPRPAADESLPLPPKDRPVLAAAIEQRCEALMTGDRTHFGALYGPTVRGVTVHSPRSLAEWILAGRKR